MITSPASPAEAPSEKKEFDPPAIIVYPAILIIVAASLSVIGIAEHLIPGAYPLIVSLSFLVAFFLIGRKLLDVINAADTESLASALTPNALAAAQEADQKKAEAEAASESADNVNQDTEEKSENN